jgi:hypothetical protein
MQGTTSFIYRDAYDRIVLNLPLRLEGDAGAFRVETKTLRLANNLVEVNVLLQAEHPGVPLI